MSRRMQAPAGQLGFDSLLMQADADNTARKFGRETAHLPSKWEEAVPFQHALIGRHHAAMLAADEDEAMRLRKEAHRLAIRLNNGEAGILAHNDAPGYVLARATAAPPGAVPLWGQDGDFLVTVEGMRVRIAMNGLFGIGSTFCLWPGFAAHAVDYDRPFLSETGYRSFVGLHAPLQPGLTPDIFAWKIIAAHVAKTLRGKLGGIRKQYQSVNNDAAL